MMFRADLPTGGESGSIGKLPRSAIRADRREPDGVIAEKRYGWVIDCLIADVAHAPRQGPPLSTPQALAQGDCAESRKPAETRPYSRREGNGR